MDTILNFMVTALDPLKLLSGKILAVLPAIAAALFLLLVGGFLSHWLRYFVETALKTIKIDDHARQVGLSNVLARLGLGPSLTYVVGVVVHATIILAFVLGAAEALGLPIVSDFLHRVVLFFPRMIGVALVMGGGLFLGNIAGQIVHRAAEANRVRGSEALMRITHGLLVIFSGIVALEILGISVNVFLDSMQIILAAIGLGCAIAFGVAFGMAGRDMAGRWIKDLTPKGARDGSGSDHEVRLRVR